MIRAIFTRSLALLLCASGVAQASPNYPDIVKTQYGTPGDAPPCTLCHATESAGPGTVTTYFGRSLLAHGALALNDGSLRRALSEMDDEQTDSDGDGIPDSEELREGSDPNDGPGNNLPIPATGCALSRAPAPMPLALALALLALCAARRRPRGSAPIFGRRAPKTERQGARQISSSLRNSSRGPARRAVRVARRLQDGDA